MGQVVVQCKGIKKSYGTDESRVEALKGIDLEIKDNELTLLVGPSGSGKTTLLSVIATILTLDEGELYLLGHEVHTMTEEEKALFRRNNLGIVFQSFFLIPTMSVVENVSLPLLISGMKPQEATEKSMSVLNKLHIGHKANFSPADLSKGQQQRVAIARALIHDAKIIICDEPTSALDHVAGNEIMELLHDLAQHLSKAVLVVTHDHRTFTFASRIVYMNDGIITPEEII